MKKRQATSYSFKCGCGRIKTVIETKDGKLDDCEVHLGKGGNCAASQVEAISRIVSLCMKKGVVIDEIIKELIAIKCNAPIYGENEGEDILSCSDAIAKSLRKWKEENQEEKLDHSK